MTLQRSLDLKSKIRKKATELHPMPKLSSNSLIESVMRRKHIKKKENLCSSDGSAAAKNKSPTIGVLAFEVARLVLRTVGLWNSLSDSEISRIKGQTLRLHGIRKFVSDNDTFLLGLALAETAESLGSLARSITILTNRCTDPVLQHFGRLFADLVKNGTDLYGLRYAGRKMERKVKKMERLAAASLNLHREAEELAEMERSLRRMHPKFNFKHKVMLQRKEVKRLRDASLWNRTYDYAVRLLARSLFTVVGRMNHVFAGADVLLVVDKPTNPLLTRFSSGYHPRMVTASRAVSDSGRVDYQLPPPWKHQNSWRRTKWSVSSRSFSGCVVGESELSVTYTCVRSKGTKHTERGNIFDGRKLSRAVFEPRCTLLNAPPSTLGAAALSLHYANVIILIEKLAGSPHLIGPDARDDLYRMLPTSIRAALRARLKTYARNSSSSVCDLILAAEWSETVTRILGWLSPLAHNMVKWQSERSFEHRLLVSSTNVLLVQTLYFAHQAKTEAAVTDLLVGLNYLWRLGKEVNSEDISECLLQKL